MKRFFSTFFLLIAGLLTAQNEYTLDTIYHPAQGEPKNVALIYFGGSEGGMASWDFASDSLPKMGYPTLAVKYHEKRDKPHMVQIPLDSIYKMILHFKGRPEIKGKKLVLDGVSKGAELVLLLGSMFPEIDAVTALAPSHVVWEGIDFSEWQDKSTWMYQGEDISYLPYDRSAMETSKNRVDAYRAAIKDANSDEGVIKVENINGPILLFSGESDEVWPASQMGDMIMERLKKNKFIYRYEHHSCPDASHTLSTDENASGTIEGNKKANEHYYKTYKTFLEELNEPNRDSNAELLREAQIWAENWNGKIDGEKMMAQYDPNMQYYWRGKPMDYKTFDRVVKNFIVPRSNYDIYLHDEIITILDIDAAVVSFNWTDRNATESPASTSLTLKKVDGNWKIICITLP